MAIAVSQALPVHRDQRETKDPGDEEDTKETKALWDLLEKVASKASWDQQVRRVMLDSREKKGDIGPAGMPGAKGEPGESISAPVVAVSPKTLTVNEGGSVSFHCSVSGNPDPVIVWSKTIGQYSQTVLSGGKMLLKNVQGSDLGTYNCSAVNILGQAQALVQLMVNGKIAMR